LIKLNKRQNKKEMIKMKILSDKIIKDYYDVIVVGAGIGGITAGALLANKGLSTLVIEQHYLPGGVCSTIKRNDTCMDAGAALLFGWNNQTDPHPYVMNSLKEDIDIIAHEAIYRMHFQGGRSVTFWKDFDRYFKELVQAFPGKEDQFKGFYDECFKLYNGITKNPLPMSPDTVPPGLGLKMLLKHPFSTLKIPKIMNGSLKDVLYKYVKDKDVEGFFDLLIGSCYCTTVEETPLLLAAAVVCSTHTDGAFYPAGSPQMLPNKLEKALEKNNGTILYSNMVEKILIDNNIAYGVKLENGTIIKSEKIVTDVTIWNLYEKLIDSIHIKPESLKWAQSYIPTASALIVYLSVKAEAIPEGSRSIEAFIGDLKVMYSNNYFVYIPSVDDPSICPEGVHSVSILTSAGNYRWPRPWEKEYQGKEYNKEKNRIAQEAIDAVTKYFPKFRESILSMEIGTPSTVERFTLKNYGTVGGPKQQLGKHLLNRLRARSEFEGVYCVGDSTVMGEGVVSVTQSAIGAANMVLKDLKMKQYMPQKFDNSYVHFVEGNKRLTLPSIDEKYTDLTAKRAAQDCQWCEEPGCIKECPAGIIIHNFVRRIEAGNYIGAAREIREKNPLGEVCGWLCPSEELCEASCNRFDFSDHSTQIKKLHAWACEQAGKDGWVSEFPERNGKKVAVVGAGPAGLSSSYFLSRLGYTISIFEKENKIGGMMMSAIPKERLPVDVLERDLNGIISAPGININLNTEVGKDIKLSNLSKEFDAVILSTGLSEARTINLPNSENADIIDALTYLKISKQNGISLNSHKKNKVLIIGGGSVASDVATVVKKNGADQISIVCLENESEMPCLKSELKEMKQYGININNSWGPKEINIEGNSLSCVECISVFDKEGKFNPEFKTENLKNFEFDQLIYAIGQKVSKSLESHLKEELNITSIEIEPETNKLKNSKNIYVAGDLSRGPGLIVEAVADGRKIANQIHQNQTN
jgi:NADPH-dependent glutamate synthase beta subunit-like oxidoreductase